MERLSRITRGQVRLASAMMTLLGVLYTWWALQLSAGDPPGSGEGGTPMVVGVLWVVVGTFVTLRAGPIHEHNDEVGTWPDRGGWLRLVIVGSLCLGFVAFMGLLGTIFTSFIFMTLMARLCDASWSRSLVASAAMSVFLWLLFVKFLQLSLPVGAIFSLWPGA